LPSKGIDTHKKVDYYIEDPGMIAKPSGLGSDRRNKFIFPDAGD
jgi:hypothetical protein